MEYLARITSASQTQHSEAFIQFLVSPLFANPAWE